MRNLAYNEHLENKYYGSGPTEKQLPYKELQWRNTQEDSNNSYSHVETSKNMEV